MNVIKFLNEIKEPKVSELGGKGYSLAVLMNHSFNVPKGFVTTSEVFFKFLEENELVDIIKKQTEKINENNYQDKCKEIRNLILNGEISQQIMQEIEKAIEKLNKDIVTIRSSAISEDSPKESFAGLHDSFIGIKCELNTIAQYIKKCWASLFNDRAIIYRIKKNLSLLDGMAVIIQEMINGGVSGIVFTQHPLQKENMLIESSYGLGTLIVGGKISPDSFLISRKSLSITDAFITSKYKICKINEVGMIKKVNVPRNKKDIPSLSVRYIRELSKTCLNIEKLFGEPQDIEWCLYNNDIYILQSRAITKPNKKLLRAQDVETRKTKVTQILSGVAASPGEVIGSAKIIKKDIDLKKVEIGNIVVTPRATPKILSIVNKISGIISEEGSIISHAAIIAREFMIPCVVNVKKATQVLNDNVKILLDGTVGKIYIFNSKNRNLTLLRYQNMKLEDSKLPRKRVANMPKLEDLKDINKLVENGKIVLSPMGRRVVQTPNFAEKWKNFILSLKLENIVDSWRDTLGKFLSFLVELMNVDDKHLSIDILNELIEIHNNFYMYNMLADCYDPYPLFRQIVENYTIPHLNSKIIEHLIDYSINYEIPYNELKKAVYIPLQSSYIPIGTHRTEKASYKNFLIELSRAYTLDKNAYINMLSKLEEGKLNELGIHVEVPKVEKDVKVLAYEIFINVLQSEEKVKFELCVELIEHFGIINDINRLVGKEFAQEAKRVVDALIRGFDIDLESDWPWEQLLELYIKLHARRYKIERE